MQTMRNRRSPRVPNEPWRGPGNLTIPQIVALFCAFLVAVVVWWTSGHLPGSSAFGILAGRMILTGFVGGIVAVLFYAAADPSREPFVRQHMMYSFRRHTYRKEPAHGTHPAPIPFPSRAARPRAAISLMDPARAGIAHAAATFRAVVAAIPGRRARRGA